MKNKMGGKNSDQDSSLEHPVHKIVALVRSDGTNYIPAQNGF